MRFVTTNDHSLQTGNRQTQTQTRCLKTRVNYSNTRQMMLSEVKLLWDWSKATWPMDLAQGLCGLIFVINDDLSTIYLSIMHGYKDTWPQKRYWGYSLDEFNHVTIGSTYSKYNTIKPNQQWIQCSIAEIYPSEDADLWMLPYATLPHGTDTASKIKTLLSWHVTNQ